VGRLIYSAIMSLDGFIADEDGVFDWAAPDEEVHAFVNDLERPIGTYLLGRRMYEVMAVWDSPAMASDESAVARDFAAIWRAADKVVYSRTLDTVSTGRTRLVRDFDPDEVRRMKTAADLPLTIGGPELAAQALESGVVDELQLLIVPIIVGGGNAALPAAMRIPLSLSEEQRFGNGTVFLRYLTPESERA
jgi:dihydrofolate reductase